MKDTNNRMNERGAAMVIALLALVVLTVVGTLFIAQTKTETQIAGHDQRSNQALTHAEAGYGEVLARMSVPTDSVNYMGPPPYSWITQPGWGRYLVMASGNSAQDPNRGRIATDGLDNNLNGTVDESGETYPETRSKQGANPLSYPWVQVHYKLNAANQVLLFGDHDRDINTPPQPNLQWGLPMLVITAYGGEGTARRTVQVEAVRPPFEILDGALYTEVDQFKFNGTQFLISGEDHDPVTGAVIPGNAEVPGMLTTGNPANITSSLSGQQTNNITGTGAEPSVDRATVDVDLQTLHDTYIAQAQVILPAGTYSGVSWGDLDHYTSVWCQGDMHISGDCTGGGLLIVDGDLSITGSFTWYGVVLVMGSVTFSGGGNDIHIYGSCLSQGGVNDQTVGGNADILYSSEALNRLTALSPYVVYNWHEL
jgi:type IV pilus assembly PilX-like protein